MIDNTGPAFWSTVPNGFNLSNYIFVAGQVGYVFTDTYNASYFSAVGFGSSDNIRTAQGRNDKRYAEITVNSGSMPNGVMRIGIFQTSGNVAPPIGNSIPSAGYGSHIGGTPAAFVTVNGAVIIPSAAVYSVGNTVMVAFDGSTGNMWFGLDGSWLTGNPATGASPTATIATGTYFVAVCADESGSGNGSFNVTGRFQTGATIYAIPSGFSGVDD